MSGWEWPSLDQPTCGALAEDRATGRQIACGLRRGHTSQEHHWEQIEGDLLHTASWIVTGHVTFIGEPRA